MDAFYFLNKLESYGYQAYLVGGFIRDHLIGIQSFDIDITTDATPKTIGKIFGVDIPEDRIGSVYFQTDKYNVDITTFRRELRYENRHPIEIEYIKDLKEDLKRRDFTINAIAEDSSAKLIDLFGGLNDLENRLVKSIGNPDEKFREDPLRMLRAIRFASVLDFTIEENTLQSLNQNKELIRNLSYSRKKEELSKILTTYKGVKYLNELDLLAILEIEVPKNFKPSKNALSCWAQLKHSDKYPFSKQEVNTIKNIKDILVLKKIGPYEIYCAGLENALIAGEILGMRTLKIKTIYDTMSIHNERDLCLNGRDIKKILDLEDDRKIKEIKLDLIKEILSGNLLNDVSSTREYIIKEWK